MQAGLTNLEACPALVLNADYRPLSYYPLSIVSWQEAIKNVFLDRVNVVDTYDRLVHTPSQAFRLPSVISLKSYVKPARSPAFTRFNVFLRDQLTCQYCGETAPVSELTFDHVIPHSKGGRTTWDNVVTACSPCNLKKGDKMPKQCGMIPAITPRQPTVHQLWENGRRFPRGFLHESWHDYLYWDSELEP